MGPHAHHPPPATQQVGWDTDEFLTDPREAAAVAEVILAQGGLRVGVNFDAKLRRESTDVEDLFVGHIAGMDALARGLRAAAAAAADGRLAAMRAARYASYSETPLGREIASGKVTFERLAAAALAAPDPAAAGLPSGRQELYEAIFNQFV
jgi:xylose isomerase